MLIFLQNNEQSLIFSQSHFPYFEEIGDQGQLAGKICVNSVSGV